MLDIRWIRENPQALVAALKKRPSYADTAQATVDGLIAKDEARRAHISELQEAQERRNAASKEIGNAMRAKDMARAETLKEEIAGIKAFIQGGEARRFFPGALWIALLFAGTLGLARAGAGDEGESRQG